MKLKIKFVVYERKWNDRTMMFDTLFDKFHVFEIIGDGDNPVKMTDDYLKEKRKYDGPNYEMPDFIGIYPAD